MEEPKCIEAEHRWSYSFNAVETALCQLCGIKRKVDYCVYEYYKHTEKDCSECGTHISQDEKITA